MGRLAEGGQAAPSGDVDATTGTRRVPVLTVGRDGSIQAPAEESAPQRPPVTVPGMVISGLGGPPPPKAETADVRPEPTAARMTTTAAEPQTPVVVSPPPAPKKPEAKLASVEEPAAPPVPQSAADAADASAAAPSAPPKKAASAPKKTAAVAAPSTAATVSSAAQPAPTGAGWVAVLASVPASAKSRMEALKQFADMQQKYGALLQNKTPDIQEANLGEKGTYHRLMVGPPGSREMASELCTQLKAQGYPSCWVTAY
jgi:hypothetical protein